MDNLSSVTIALSLVGFIFLVVALVMLFYKPPKKLKVVCKFKDYSNKNIKSVVEIDVENIGKKRMKILAPYIKFSHTTHSKLFQLKSEKAICRFPRIIKIGDKLNCEVDLSQYASSLESISFKPTHVKIFLEDTAGLRFYSQNMEFDK